MDQTPRLGRRVTISPRPIWTPLKLFIRSPHGVTTSPITAAYCWGRASEYAPLEEAVMDFGTQVEISLRSIDQHTLQTGLWDRDMRPQSDYPDT